MLLEDLRHETEEPTPEPEQQICHGKPMMWIDGEPYCREGHI